MREQIYVEKGDLGIEGIFEKEIFVRREAKIDCTKSWEYCP